MSKNMDYYLTARQGPIPVDSILCEPCGRTIPIVSLQAHKNGKKHLQKVKAASTGNDPPHPSTLQQAFLSQPTSNPRSTPTAATSRPSWAILADLEADPWDIDTPSQAGSSEDGPRSTPHAAASPLTWGDDTADFKASPLVTQPGSGSRTKIAYCSTTLMGAKCTDSRCQYCHDVSRCEPCGRSFPAPLLKQHQSGKQHLSNVAANGASTNPGTPQSSLTVNLPKSQPAPPQTTLPSSSGNTFTIVQVEDPRVIVSGKSGLDFIAGEIATVAYRDPSFPVVRHNISIKKGTMTSSLSVQSMTLALSPSRSCECSSVQWCECFESCLYEELSHFFLTAFLRP
jgi:hypothetical protein